LSLEIIEKIQKLKAERKLMLEKRKKDAEQKQFYDWLMPTFGEGGIPEGSPSYVKDNMITRTGTKRVNGALDMHYQMNNPEGTKQL
jgi:hypothetical protein